MKTYLSLAAAVILGFSLNAQSNDTVVASQISFLPGMSTNGDEAPNLTNKFSWNVIAGNNGGVDGFEIGMFNHLNYDLNGVQLGFVNTVSNRSEGAQLGIWVNQSKYFTHGAQFGGLVNIASGCESTSQFAGLVNVAEGNNNGLQAQGLVGVHRGRLNGAQLSGLVSMLSDTLQGMQASGLVSLTTAPASGAQLSGLVSTSESMNGAQFSGLVSNTGELNGAQISGLVSTADTVTGFQLAGLVNRTGRLTGFQLGLINVADTVSGGAQLGLLSFGDHGAIELAANEVFYGQINFETGSENLYNKILLGSDFQGNNMVWGVGYGLGSRIRLNDKNRMAIEALAWQVSEGYDFTNKLNLLTRFNVNWVRSMGSAAEFTFGPAANLYITQVYDAETNTYGSDIAPYVLAEGLEYGYPNNTFLQFWVGWNVGIKF